MARCALCSDLLDEPGRAALQLCLLCAHRTTASERRTRRPLEAGVIDSA